MNGLERQRLDVILDFIEEQGGDPLFGRDKLVVACGASTPKEAFIGRIAYRLGHEFLFSLSLQINATDAEAPEHEVWGNPDWMRFDLANDEPPIHNMLVLDVAWVRPASFAELSELPSEWFDGIEEWWADVQRQNA